MNIQRLILWSWGLGTLGFLYVPVLLLILFSFNHSPMAVTWDGFSLEWYRQLLHNRGLWEATKNSLLIAGSSTLISVIMGTGAAIVLHQRAMEKWRLLTMTLLTPLVIPEILMGVALLLFFVMVRMPLGLLSVTISHIVFNLPLVVVIIQSRLRKLDPTLNEAARDLGATPWQTFWWITFPLLKPAIAGAALMAFTISLDDFVVTFFTTGPGATTLPLKVFSLIKTGITPEVNALSTLLVVASMLFIALSLFFQQQPVTSRSSDQEKETES